MNCAGELKWQSTVPLRQYCIRRAWRLCTKYEASLTVESRTSALAHSMPGRFCRRRRTTTHTALDNSALLRDKSALLRDKSRWSGGSVLDEFHSEAFSVEPNATAESVTPSPMIPVNRSRSEGQSGVPPSSPKVTQHPAAKSSTTVSGTSLSAPGKA